MKLKEKIIWQLRQRRISILKFIYSAFIKKINVNGVLLPLKNWYSNKMFQFILSGEYESQEMQIIKKHLDLNDKVVEFGTGLGLLSAYCAMIAGDDNVYTFEGNEKLESVIRETYLLNNVNPFLCFALIGSEEKEVAFHVEPKNIWASSTTSTSLTSKPFIKKQLEANAIIEKYRPTFLIIDIEGAEQAILPTLNLNNVHKLQTEFHPFVYGVNRMQELIQIIKGKGFKMEAASDPQTFYFYRTHPAQ